MMAAVATAALVATLLGICGSVSGDDGDGVGDGGGGRGGIHNNQLDKWGIERI
jgi:hypothetical protein